MVMSVLHARIGDISDISIIVRPHPPNMPSACIFKKAV